MKLSVDRELLVNALQGVAGIIPARSPKPSRCAALIEVEGNRCTVSGTDGETWVTRSVLGATGHEDGRSLLPMPRLLDAVQKARGELAEIEADDSSATVKIRRSEFRMVAFPAIEWLDHGHEFPDGCEAFLVPAPDLRRAFQRTASSTDPVSTNYALGGMNLDLDGETLVVESYDGRQSASQSITVVLREGSWPDPSPVIPEKAAALSRKNFSDEDPVGVAAGPSSIMLRDTRCTMVTRQVNGRFPNWRNQMRQYLDREDAVTVVIPQTSDIVGLMSEMAVMTTKDSAGVLLRVGDGSVEASIESADSGRSRSAIDCEPSGESHFILACDRLTSLIRPLDQESPITLIENRGRAIVRIQTGDGFYGALAKMHFKQEGQ